MAKKLTPREVLNNKFPEMLDKHLKEVFGDRGFKTSYAFFAGRMVTNWDKKTPKKYAKKYREYIRIWTEGYGIAMDVLFFEER